MSNEDNAGYIIRVLQSGTAREIPETGFEDGRTTENLVDVLISSLIVSLMSGNGVEERGRSDQTVDSSSRLRLELF